MNQGHKGESYGAQAGENPNYQRAFLDAYYISIFHMTEEIINWFPVLLLLYPILSKDLTPQVEIRAIDRI